MHRVRHVLIQGYEGGGGGFVIQTPCPPYIQTLYVWRPRVPQKYRGHVKDPHLPFHIGHVLRLPGAVSLDVLHNASLRITLTVPEVVDTENWVTSSLPFLLDPSSIAKMQS